MARRKNGEGSITVNGYLMVTKGSVGIGAGGKPYVGAVSKLQHVSIVEKSLGRELRGEEEVHHVDHNRLNNTNHNLVVCPDRAYHMLLHQRERALDACGHADWLRCAYCKTYDDPVNMKFRARGSDRPGQLQWTHPQCARDYANSKSALKRAKRPPDWKPGNVLLTEDQVRAIRSWTGSQRAAGKYFGITQAAVSLIVRRKNWGWLE